MTSFQIHNKYGKLILRKAAGTAYTDSGESVCIYFNNSGIAKIDGTVGKNIAIEIESRVNKQIRGAILDLILHKYPKKLLVLLPVHMSNPETTINQCNFIMEQFLDVNDFRVVLLKGHGNDYRLDVDPQIVKNALKELSFSS